MEKKKEVTIEAPVAVGEVTLIPVAKVSLKYEYSKRGISFFGVKQPIAVVVISVSARRAFRITGEEVSIDQLVQEITGLKRILEGI